MPTTRKPYRIEVLTDKTKKQPHRWRIVCSNGRILCHSERYSRKYDTVNAISNFCMYVASGLGDIEIDYIDETE